MSNKEIKILRKILAVKVIGMIGSRELQFKISPEQASDEWRAKIAAKFPGIVILNGMTDAELDRVIDKNGVN